MANAQFKKGNGGPNLKFFESPETIQNLESVTKWLQKNCKKVRCVRRPD